MQVKIKYIAAAGIYQIFKAEEKRILEQVSKKAFYNYDQAYKFAIEAGWGVVL